MSVSDQIVSLDWWRLPYVGHQVFKEKVEAILSAERTRIEHDVIDAVHKAFQQEGDINGRT